MASLFFRNGVWYGRHIYYVGQKGARKRKEKRKSFETSNPSEARRRLVAWENELGAVKWGECPKLPFEEAAQRFVDNHCKALRVTTAERYATHLKRLKPHFDGKLISKISRKDLMAFEIARRKDDGRDAGTKLNPISIKRDLLCLSSMFSYWSEEEWVDFNPVTAFLKARKKAGLKESQPRRRYLSHAEEDRLIAAALQPIGDGENPWRTPGAHDHLRRMLHTAIVVAIDTGLRLEELFSLTWPQVELRGDAHVVVEGKGGKTRRVPLFDRAARALADLTRHKKGEFVFWWAADGRRFLDLRRSFAAACERAEISDITWHDLRRTCGCRLLQDHGTRMEDVQVWLGHSSIKTTERHYAFLREESLSSIVERSRRATPVPAAPRPAFSQPRPALVVIEQPEDDFAQQPNVTEERSHLC